MSLSVIAAVGGILATIVTMGETRNLPLTAAAALSGYKLFEYAQEKESEKIKAQFATPETPIVIQPPVAVAAGAQVNVAVENQVNIAVPVQSVAPPPVTTIRAMSPLIENQEEIDLPKLISDGIHNGILSGHLFMSCRTGSGKTTTVRAFMRALFEKEPVQFIIADPKGSSWMGLESGKTLCRIREYKDVKTFLRWVEGLKDILNTRIHNRETGNIHNDPRIVLILDEWPTIWDLSREAKIDEQLKMGLNALVRLGREDKVNVWVVGQSYLVTESGFSRTSQNNFEMIALGRGSQLQSVRSMITDQYIVQDPALRSQLLSELSQIESSEQPVFFFGSTGKLGTLPDLREYTDWEFPKDDTSNH
jgi:hypothetical protein